MKGYKHLNCEQRYTVAHIYKQSKAEDNFDAVAPSGAGLSSLLRYAAR